MAFFNERRRKRLLGLLAIFVLSSLYVAWKQWPTAHVFFSESALLPAGYVLKVDGVAQASGQLRPGERVGVPLPLGWRQRHRVNLEMRQDNQRVATFTAWTGLQGLDVYVDPSLNFSTEQMPPGFIPVYDELPDKDTGAGGDKP